jgi:Fic family protein
LAQTVLSSELKDSYLVNSLIEEAVSSSQLEGAVTTRRVARELIRTGRKPTDKSEQMILNNYQTMQEIRKLKERPLDITLMWEIHRLITHDTLKNPDEEGRFRESDEEVDVVDYETGVVFHRPPPFEELGQRMHVLYNFANCREPDWFMHPVIRSIILHFYLAYVHPFVDGNGRAARALFYWSMLKHGYELFEYISISHFIQRAKARYYRAFLYTETDENDLTYFILYHLEVIRKAVEALHEYVGRKSEELAQLESELQGMSVLNHRQRVLISHALKQPEQSYTIHSHQVSHDVVYETARRDLFGLRDLGLLEARKKGRTYYFTPVEGLEKKLGLIKP